jgi:hypothetical protein
MHYVSNFQVDLLFFLFEAQQPTQPDKQLAPVIGGYQKKSENSTRFQTSSQFETLRVSH